MTDQTYQRGHYAPQKNYRSSTALYLLLPGCWNKSSIQSPAAFTKHNFSKTLPIFDFIIITYQSRIGVRDYDPDTGRWTAKDPLLFVGQQTNLYSYVSGDPVNKLDLWGTQTGCTRCPPIPEGGKGNIKPGNKPRGGKGQGQGQGKGQAGATCDGSPKPESPPRPRRRRKPKCKTFTMCVQWSYWPTYNQATGEFTAELMYCLAQREFTVCE